MEKKVERTNVSGNKFEDLPESEMNQVQGQGSADISGEAVTTITIATAIGPILTVIGNVTK